MNALNVFSNGEWVGRLSVENGVWEFTYAAMWKKYALSPNLPLVPGAFQDTADVRTAEWFFDNLLPEGRLRDLIAERERIDRRDTFSFLVRNGREVAGALCLVSAEEAEKEKEFISLSKKDLQKKVSERTLLKEWKEVRMSLAGAQDKMGVYIDEEGKLFLPKGAASSTHIIKPDNANMNFVYCPANEFFCMQVAKKLNIPVSETDLWHLPEPIYVIKRFDREEADQGIYRIHQIDLCQMLNVGPFKKYESDGGLGLEDLCSTLKGNLLEFPIVAVQMTVRWVIFNYLIGNLDAHAKNIAFLVKEDGMTLAPFYDLLSVEVYFPNQPMMAMSIAGENRPGWIEGMHWDALAYELGVAPRFVRQTLVELSDTILLVMQEVIKDERLLPKEKKFVKEKIIPITRKRIDFIQLALKEKTKTIKELLVTNELDKLVKNRLVNIK
jgi:serine/threonine-protein kinase HipA